MDFVLPGDVITLMYNAYGIYVFAGIGLMDKDTPKMTVIDPDGTIRYNFDTRELKQALRLPNGKVLATLRNDQFDNNNSYDSDKSYGYDDGDDDEPPLYGEINW